jgi:hypothetical protein
LFPSEAFAQLEEDLAQLSALRGGETGEDLVLRVALRLSGPVELTCACRGERHYVPSALAALATTHTQGKLAIRVQ